MKVVLISQNASPGLLIFRKDFIRYLIACGHSVYCFALDYSASTRLAVEAMGAIPIDYSLNKAGLNPFRDVRDTFALTIKIKDIKPDIVFSFFVKPSIYGTLAAKFAGAPRRIAMLEGLGYIHTPAVCGFGLKKYLLQRVHGLLSTIGYLFAHKVLFLNSSDPVDLAKVSYINTRKFIEVGPIGLSLEQFPYSSADLSKPLRFVFVARLLAEKGIFEFLNAARIVRASFPEVEFLVLGGLDFDNPTALSPSQLQAVIDEGLIIYPGHVTDVASWLIGSHVFVLPSYREGFPRSTQEAMAIGRAVITTNVPGCRETVVDGLNGFLVPPFDSKVLAEKMIYFVKNPDAVLRMGRESNRMAVDKFDADKINPVLTEIITGISS
ncbi:glycosyltransferase family 4 protein [Pseudomonas stutzeri]|uniref:glycosyltransferase family 4 protein n=1 Tax=Stutzerimonas stutzeri TaxID=316 RepID=UPI0021095520|nr:glycosyltransferase family 4 protein [Stutzerimonas stutzeri]MCQ4230892.1 glycosyltransferase family 4 protein [Stutzerimonas stutzeri]